jgi:hypothetical protein
MTHPYARAGGKTVDSVMGYIKGQPIAPGLSEVRSPEIGMTVRFKADGSTYKLEHTLQDSLHNITKVFLVKANISGIVGSHDNLILDFNCSSGGNTEIGTGNFLVGFPQKPNTLVVECNGAANVVVNNAGPPQLLSVFKQPRTFNHIGLNITNSDGTPVAYRECVVWLQMETMRWQTL